MTVAAADLLTEATVPRYLEDRWDDISRALQVDLEAPSAMEGVTVTAIQGGNLNYAFCVTFPNLKGGGNGKRTLFLKQVGVRRPGEEGHGGGDLVGTATVFAVSFVARPL